MLTKKYGTCAFLALCMFFLNFSTLLAQTPTQEVVTPAAASPIITPKAPIFGTYTPAKDTAQRRFSLRPAFVRFGFTGGGFVGVDSSSSRRGGAAGVRMEIGFSNHLSLVGNAEMGRINQGTLALHWQPFNSMNSRWQPYFGAGWSATAASSGNLFEVEGNKGFGRHKGFEGFEGFETNNFTISHSLALQTGFNYLLRRHWIAHIDATYQQPLNTAVNKIGTAGVRFGISRQF
jgi:OmpW family